MWVIRQAIRMLQLGDGVDRLTTLIIEVVHSPLWCVVEGGRLMDAGAGQEQRGGELQGRGEGARAGMGGSASALEVLQTEREDGGQVKGQTKTPPQKAGSDLLKTLVIGVIEAT